MTEYHFNEKGNEIMEEVVKLAPRPVLFAGKTGYGKSYLIRAVCEQLQRHFEAVNAYPGMDISMWVGMWRPTSNDQGGVGLVWEDGVLTRSIRNGDVFFLEELSRAPQDATARVFGLMDTSFRFWSLPEAGMGNVPVHDDFWLIATANPTSNDYYTYNLDRALQSRFAAVYNIDGPICDEQAVIEEMVDKDVAKRLMRVVTDTRKDPAAAVNTRDLVLCAELISKGFDPLTAVARAVAPKYGEKGAGIINLMKEHFRTA